ncbi:flavodoxin [Methanococcus maripaludis]|uniref:Flavodoxin n=1 Tax=Methanococcus maripaludis TaxID=39152 RepID=A0A7J9NJI9_METMI|nr:flavodoxin [Methanococcus maripaludis]MBA2840419.1 flavodoxin [Methanococcus maripaludis]
MPDLKENKCLIAYFSRAGNNYVGGQIVNLQVGNTKIVAETIHEIIGGDLFQIDTVTPYPKDYSATTNVAKKELNENARPKLTGHVTNMDSYDTIFLGYPNWLGTAPMAVFTFLEEYDFSGKTIIPFCTHEGSGMGHSESDIEKTCPDAKILNVLSIYGSQVNSSKKDIEKWLDKLGIL